MWQIYTSPQIIAVHLDRILHQWIIEISLLHSWLPLLLICDKRADTRISDRDFERIFAKIYVALVDTIQLVILEQVLSISVWHDIHTSVEGFLVLIQISINLKSTVLNLVCNSWKDCKIVENLPRHYSFENCRTSHNLFDLLMDIGSHFEEVLQRELKSSVGQIQIGSVWTSIFLLRQGFIWVRFAQSYLEIGILRVSLWLVLILSKLILTRTLAHQQAVSHFIFQLLILLPWLHSTFILDLAITQALFCDRARNSIFHHRITLFHICFLDFFWFFLVRHFQSRHFVHLIVSLRLQKDLFGYVSLNNLSTLRAI